MQHHHPLADSFNISNSAASPKALFKTVVVIIFSALIALSLNILTTYLISNRLSVHAFGDFSGASSLFRIMSFLILCGTDSAIVRFLSFYFSKRQWASASGYLHFNLKWLASLTVVIFLLSVCLIGFNYFSDTEFKRSQYLFNHPILHYLWLVPIMVLITITGKLLRVLHHPIAAQLNMYFLQPAIMLVILLIALQHHLVFTENNVLLIFAISNVMSAFLQLLTLSFLFPKKLLRVRPNYDDQKIWIKTALQLFGSTLILSNVSYFCIFLVHAFSRNTQEVGYYAVVITLCGFLWTPANAIQSILTPLIYPSLKNSNSLQALIHYGSLFLLLFVSIPCLILIIFAKPILALFGTIYVHAHYLLIFTSITVGGCMMLSMPFMVMLYSNQPSILLKTLLRLICVALLPGILAITYFSGYGMTTILFLCNIYFCYTAIKFIQNKFGVNWLDFKRFQKSPS